MTPQQWIYRKMICVECHQEIYGQLTRKICTDFSEKFLYICPQCGKKGCLTRDQLWLPNGVVRKNVPDFLIKTLPAILPEGVKLCEHCGEPGTQSHHWAPKEIFGAEEAARWPQSDLCRKCHDIWHKTIESFYTNKARAIIEERQLA